MKKLLIVIFVLLAIGCSQQENTKNEGGPAPLTATVAPTEEELITNTPKEETTVFPLKFQRTEIIDQVYFIPSDAEIEEQGRILARQSVTTASSGREADPDQIDKIGDKIRVNLHVSPNPIILTQAKFDAIAQAILNAENVGIGDVIVSRLERLKNQEFRGPNAFLASLEDAVGSQLTQQYGWELLHRIGEVAENVPLQFCLELPDNACLETVVSQGYQYSDAFVVPEISYRSEESMHLILALPPETARSLKAIAPQGSTDSYVEPKKILLKAWVEGADTKLIVGEIGVVNLSDSNLRTQIANQAESENTKTFSKGDSIGSEWFGAGYNASFTADRSSDSEGNISCKAVVSANILKTQLDIVEGNCQSGETTDVNLLFVGQTIYSVTIPTSFSQSWSKSQTLASATFWVSFFAIDVSAGVDATIGIDAGLTNTGGATNLNFTPNFSVGGTGEVALSILIAKAGVGISLALISDSFGFQASFAWSNDIPNTFALVNDFKMIDGQFYIFADVIDIDCDWWSCSSGYNRFYNNTLASFTASQTTITLWEASFNWP